MKDYEDFKGRFKLLASKNRHLIVNTLSNIFTMRLIGNKTHGDLAEIGMAEFINQFMYDFKSRHVGKDLFRAKEHEEDIVVINEITKTEFALSLKAYGDGPLQLSTDSEQKMFPYLKKQGKQVKDRKRIEEIFEAKEFCDFGTINIMPLIYDEKSQRCNIMIFDHKKATKNVKKIVYVDKKQKFDLLPAKLSLARGAIIRFLCLLTRTIIIFVKCDTAALPPTLCSAVFGRIQKTRFHILNP